MQRDKLHFKCEDDEKIKPVDLPADKPNYVVTLSN